MSHSSATKLNRFRLQYSLRSLLVFVLLASVFMAWFGARYRAAREQRDAVAAIRALGANVLYDYERQEDPAWRPGPSIAGPAEPPGPAWARRLLGIDFFADATELRCTDPMERAASQVGSPMPPWGLPLTDASLGTIAELAHLERLDLGRTQMTGNGLEKLGVLRRLRELSLYKTATSDAGLDGVGRLTRLEVLDLSCCRITDAGLERLTGLVELRSLNLQRSRVTAEGVRKLQRALPKCKITCDPALGSEGQAAKDGA